MKYVILVLTMALLAIPTRAADIVSGKIPLSPVSHCLATPQFTRALAAASARVDGWKMRIDYTMDYSNRSVPTAIMVTIVGRSSVSPEKYEQASFTLHARNSCFERSATPIAIKVISERDFSSFRE